MGQNFLADARYSEESATKRSVVKTDNLGYLKTRRKISCLRVSVDVIKIVLGCSNSKDNRFH